MLHMDVCKMFGLLLLLVWSNSDSSVWPTSFSENEDSINNRSSSVVADTTFKLIVEGLDTYYAKLNANNGQPDRKNKIIESFSITTPS